VPWRVSYSKSEFPLEREGGGEEVKAILAEEEEEEEGVLY